MTPKGLPMSGQICPAARKICRVMRKVEPMIGQDYRVIGQNCLFVGKLLVARIALWQIKRSYYNVNYGLSLMLSFEKFRRNNL